MNIAELLAQSAAAFGTRPALALGETVLLDHRGLAARAAALGQALLERGIQPGERVMLWMGNLPEYLEILFGIWAAGAVAVPVNIKLHPREAGYIHQDAGVRLAFTDRPGELAGAVGLEPDDARILDPRGAGYAGMREGAQALRPATVRPESPAWIFYTSGTTGNPKGAILTHRNLWAMVLSFLADISPVTERSAALAPAPLSHAAGLFALPIVLRGGVNVIPESGGFEPAEIAALLRRWPGSFFFAAPTMLNRLVQAPELEAEAIAGLDLIFVGGAPLYATDLRAALARLGPKIWIGYGQGEAPCTISFVPPHFLEGNPSQIPEELAGSVGIPRSGVTVRIVDPEGRDLPIGEAGEVIVAGDVVMAGYLGNERATASALREGWLWTGDIGAFDAEGRLTLKDRSKDVIISGGSNIYPREVEEALLRHPGVRAVNVIGAPDADWGEVVVAFLVAEDGVSAAELDAHCLDQIARFKRPKSYRFVESLPVSSYGKILKTELRRMLAETP